MMEAIIIKRANWVERKLTREERKSIVWGIYFEIDTQSLCFLNPNTINHNKHFKKFIKGTILGIYLREQMRLE